MSAPIRPLAAAVAAVTLALAGCGPSADAGASTVEAPPLLVAPENITVVDTVLLQEGPSISGSLEPDRAATLRAELGGAVVAVLAEEGQTVAAGTPLVRLDDATAREQHRSAESAVRLAQEQAELARRNLARSERLAAAGALADQSAEQARAALLAAEAGLADAQARLTAARQLLEKTQVRAPFRGVVSARPVNLGDIVQQGTPLVTVVDPASLRLEAAVPLGALEALRQGSQVEFTLPGVEGRRFAGSIARINPAVDPLTRQVRITATVPNPEGALVAGLFAEGRVTTDTARGLAVPYTALDLRGAAPALTVLRQGRTVAVTPRLGLRDEARELIQVLEGLVAGDTVLLGATRGLAPGTPVRVGRDG